MKKQQGDPKVTEEVITLPRDRGRRLGPSEPRISEEDPMLWDADLRKRGLCLSDTNTPELTGGA